MAKNLLIFSDGTGQAGGLLPDETRSNVYKLYRATRCGPDSPIDPSLQLAFYDPGLGSQTDGGRIPFGWARWVRSVLAQGTGLGITGNIVDCYAAILALWEPGDRVYLFGFSRGAYTIRCVGGVLGLCGVPTRNKDGSPLRRDPRSIRAVAREAVERVYKYGSSIAGDPFKELRDQRAARFRSEYGSGEDGRSNAYPYFIGVFDTVAALGVTPAVRMVLAVVSALLALGVAWGLAWLLGGWLIGFWPWFILLLVLPTLVIVAGYLWTHVTWHPVNKRPYLASWSMRFYDNKLNRRVGYARHALSIDEARADFARVTWDYDGDERVRAEGEPELLRQIWFAGNHSDIGGSYAENESRLSDTSLKWLVEQLEELPHPILINEAALRLYPAATGWQHDEAMAGFPGVWGMLGFKWKTKPRPIPDNAPLHPSVLERFKAASVLQHDAATPYRPEGLRLHERVRELYERARDAP